LFNWVNDIINAIKDAFATLGTQISNSIWNAMLQFMYDAVFSALGQFFSGMGNMGAEIFDLQWVQAVVKLFSLFGWAMFVVGLAVAAFDLAIESQSGRVSMRTTALNVLKGFIAVNLFTVLPIELYKFCITLQSTFIGDLTRIFSGQQSMGLGDQSMSVLQAGFAAPLHGIGIFNLLFMIALGYCIVKIFFSNIKRGGILLIQIAVGSLFMFSIPRGYSDGFNQWVKQIIALCLTAFLQTTLLFLGLMTFSQDMLLGLGIMLSASEVPRIAQQFGLDTSVRINVMNVMHAGSMAINMTKSIAK